MENDKGKEDSTVSNPKDWQRVMEEAKRWFSFPLYKNTQIYDNVKEKGLSSVISQWTFPSRLQN